MLCIVCLVLKIGRTQVRGGWFAGKAARSTTQGDRLVMKRQVSVLEVIIVTYAAFPCQYDNGENNLVNGCDSVGQEERTVSSLILLETANNTSKYASLSGDPDHATQHCDW